MSESLFKINQAPAVKQFKNVPICTSMFFSGLYTQRSPFGSPDSRYYSRVLGGRTDILIDGLNVELTNYGTLIRRPGNPLYSTASLGSTPLTFYSFHQLGNLTNPIQVIADTAANVYSLTTTSKTNVLTKANGAGQSYFQGIGSTLYIGNGVDLQAWSGSGATRNWGIVMNATTNTTGPNGCGTGTDVAITGGIAWANPGNITANDGAFSTVTVPPTSSSSFDSGPNAPGTASVSGAGSGWGGGQNNIKIQDGVYASATPAIGVSSQYLQGLNYAFNIPSTASISGVSVSIYYATGTVTYGSSSDLWGTTWTPSDINNVNFGVEVSVTRSAANETDDSSVLLLKAGIAAGSDKGRNAIVGAPTVQIDFISITVTYTLPSGTGLSDLLEATNFGFGLSSANTVSGVLVEIKGLGNAQPAGTSLSVQILKNGIQSGTAKTGVLLNGSNSFISLGGTGDTWGTSFSPGDINSTGFGISIQGLNTGTSNGQWSVDFVRITTYGTGGPTVTLVAGTLVATTGFIYAYAYGNSNSGNVSNPTPPSALIKPATNGVQISLTASADSQVNQIRVFRTKDGGSTFFELPTSPYPNTTQNVTDNALDSSLLTQNQFPFVQFWLANSPPPAGLTKMVYHINRMWGVVGNFVYFSALLGDDVFLGVGVECWPPINVFTFPTTVNRLMPIASGLLVFTTDDIYLISGNSRTGTTGNLLTSQLFQQGVGLLSWNALDVEGNQIFLYTSDRQFITFTASGPVETGYPIGVDIQNNFDPTKVYVAAFIAGTQDKAVFLDDGSSSWYRCNWNQPPEGGPAWSPLATITGGSTAVVSVETSPGVHQLLIGQNDGTVLTRDYNVFTDNGNAYSAFATIGSLVLAKPGQLALLSAVVLELQQVGSVPSLSIMLDEISGSNFEQLIQSVNDPPRLSPSSTIMSRRWYLAQGGEPSACRHIQLKIGWQAENAKNELLTVTEIGALVDDE